ncbi:MAG: METTL5 family protein [Candidatus Woesearchaeota archaeon]
MISKKRIEIFISQLTSFKKPKESLEQYPIDETFWAELINFFHLKYKSPEIVWDFGAGTGKLSLPFFLTGSKQINFFEIDIDAIKILKKNLKVTSDLLDKDIDYKIVHKDLLKVDFSGFNVTPDLIVMNPPYGTRNKGIDSKFLKTALNFGCQIITMHKSSTKEYISNIIKNKKRDFDVFDIDYKLKQTLKHHSSKIKEINVSLFIIEKEE